MITSDRVALIDSTSGLHIETAKSRFELVMKLIDTGCYGGGYGSEAHKTVLAHFEQQIGATRDRIAKEEAEEAQREHRRAERAKGPVVDFDSWWAQLLSLAKRHGYDPEDANSGLTEHDKNAWRIDYWQEGYNTEEALEHFFASCG